MRAEFPNMVGRTLDGLHGLMFRKETLIKCDDSLRQYLENVNGSGKSARQFISDTGYELLQVGFGGVLDDAPARGDVSQKEAEMNGEYPYMTYYKAEDIINWRYESVGRRKKLSLVVLQETYEEENGDEYTVKQKVRWRVLSFGEAPNGKIAYRQRLFTQDDIQVPVMDIFPQKGNEYLDEIPFFFMPSDVPEKPMLMDLVEVNHALYRKSADYENGMHYCSIPCPYTMGFTPEGETNVYEDENGNEIETTQAPEPIKLTSNRFLHFPDSCTHVGMLESSGSGLPTIRTAMADDEERMAILGARIISQEKKGVEAVDTARIHRAGENAVLGTFAMNLSEIFTKVFKTYLEWCTGRDDIEIEIKINTDYDVGRMNGSELTSLISAWQGGAISKRILFDNLKDGEIIDGKTTFEDMMAELDEETPALPQLPLMGE